MSNYFKRTKRAWEENEYDDLRRNPRMEDDFPRQKEALFPREIIQPLYERFNEEMKNRALFIGPPTAADFFHYLLIQSKPEL